MPDWKELYKAAVLEADNSKMEARLKEAEESIFQRLQEMNASSGVDGEAQEFREIQQATAAIQTLRVERLGWPDLRGSRWPLRGAPPS